MLKANLEPSVDQRGEPIEASGSVMVVGGRIGNGCAWTCRCCAGTVRAVSVGVEAKAGDAEHGCREIADGWERFALEQDHVGAGWVEGDTEGEGAASRILAMASGGRLYVDGADAKSAVDSCVKMRALAAMVEGVGIGGGYQKKCGVERKVPSSEEGRSDDWKKWQRVEISEGINENFKGTTTP